MTYLHTVEVHNRRSAEQVLPLLYKEQPFRSVLDVGCGLGTWLAVAKDLGATEVLGLEGERISQGLLAVSPDVVIQADLRKPFALGRRFDLVICLEVAEHLPEPSADALVDSIVAHSDRILFSAAVPQQGGQDHVNEQWPDYWAAKFGRHDVGLLDTLRPQIWNNSAVEWWYRQNLLIGQKGARLDPRAIQRVIHPEMFAAAVSTLEGQCRAVLNGEMGMRTAISVLKRTLARGFRGRVPVRSARR